MMTRMKVPFTIPCTEAISTRDTCHTTDNSNNFSLIVIRYTSTPAGDIKSLDKVLNLIKPKRGIIPIHTEYPEKFTEIFGKIAPIILLDDKETLNCTVHD